jgi:sulfur-oxidizing protein SoxZ
MPDPMRIRATEQPDGVDVRVLMSHEMEGGQRRDSAGNLVPAHFPYLQFKFKGGKKGDKLSVTWVDNKGETRTDEITIG